MTIIKLNILLSYSYNVGILYYVRHYDIEIRTAVIKNGINYIHSSTMM